MTKERFTLDSEENGLCKCILMNGEDIPTCEVVELLNELHEENKELKTENAQFDILIKNNQLAYIDLEKENEQLKIALKDKENLINICEKKFKEL